MRPQCVLHGTLLWLGTVAGCGEVPAARPAPLLSVPLAINGTPVGEAVVDTGGGYEVILRETFGLKVIDSAEVLAFGGTELVDVTEGFHYQAGGWEAHAESALVGVSVCDCNGLGFRFFRKTGAVLFVDFATETVEFRDTVPPEGTSIPFEPPPSFLANFPSAFVEVELAAGEESTVVSGLLDTGTNVTVMRRGLVGRPSFLTPDRLPITVSEKHLGTVVVSVRLFDTAGLPDVILGTDVLSAWSDQWYFSFTPEGGTVTVFPRSGPQTPPTAGLRRAGAR